MKMMSVMMGLLVWSLAAVAQCKPVPCVASPDGRIEAFIGVTDGVPHWSVSRDHKPLLESGRLGMRLGDGKDVPVEMVRWKIIIF